MDTAKSRWIPPELFAEMQEAADKAAKGIRDPDEMRKAGERMDRMREEIFRKHGLLDIGVPAIRELRGELPDPDEVPPADSGAPRGLPPEVLADLERAVQLALSGERDPEFERRVQEQADRIREELYRKHGLLDIGVPARRALRDGE